MVIVRDQSSHLVYLDKMHTNNKPDVKILLSQNVTSDGAVSRNVLYYQQLSTDRYQVKLYANNYFP